MPVFQKKATIGAFIGLGLFIITIFSASRILAYRDQGQVPPGVVVVGVKIGSLTSADAAAKLAQTLVYTSANYLTFKSSDTGIIRLPFARYGIAYNLKDTVVHASDPTVGTLFNRLTYHAWVRGGEKSIDPQLDWNPDVLPDIVHDLKQKADTPPRNATVIYRNERLEYSPHVTGRVLNEKKTAEVIRTSLNQGKTVIPIILETRKPSIKMQDIQNIQDLLGVFMTSYDPRQKARTKNVELASAHIDGTIVMPGQTFSMNETIGPRVSANGYQKAPVLTSNGLSKDIGGGVCQVATTLYDAVVQANLDIVERKPHSQPINYAPPGMDATILGSLTDFKFKNTSPDPVMISVTAQDGKIYCRIFGHQSEQYQKTKVLTESEVIPPKEVVKYDSTLPEGVKLVSIKGKKGYRVKTYQVRIKDGKEVGRKLLSEDYYRGRDTVVTIGKNPAVGQNK